MPPQLFATTSKHKRINPVVWTGPHISKDARAAAITRQREATQRYKANLDDTWVQMDKTIKNIATQHQRSIKQVQQQLHLGRSLGHGKHKKNSYWNTFLWKKGQEHKADESKPFIFFSRQILYLKKIDASPSCRKRYLPHASQGFGGEYEELTKEEKNHILAEFEEYKAYKENGHRISTKSRVNDCTHTVQAITNEVLFLSFISYVWQ